MQHLAKFKRMLHIGLRAALNVRKFKVAVNPMSNVFLSLSKVASRPADYNSIIKNCGHRTCFLVIGT